MNQEERQKLKAAVEQHIALTKDEKNENFFAIKATDLLALLNRTDELERCKACNGTGYVLYGTGQPDPEGEYELHDYRACQCQGNP